MKNNIYAILIGRKGSKGFKGKNKKKILGKKLFEYPIDVLKSTKGVSRVFISTDDQEIKAIAKKKGLINLYRPKKLATSKALGEDVFYNAYKQILNLGYKDPKYIILAFCNSPTLNRKGLIKGINLLDKNKKADSAVSVSRYNMWSPLRARKMSKQGYLVPFVKFDYFGDPKTLNCDRDSQGDVYFADMGFSIIRPYCLENLNDGLLPQKWMGKKILPVIQDAGLDIDYEWQLPQAEWWIKNNF